jgi:hypothetical protein
MLKKEENETILVFCFASIFRTLVSCHQLLDLRNGARRVETLGARPCAVENGVATVDAHAVIQGVLALGGLLVTGIGEPTVGLEEDGGSEVLLRVPPVRGAGG